MIKINLKYNTINLLVIMLNVNNFQKNMKTLKMIINLYYNFRNLMNLKK